MKEEGAMILEITTPLYNKVQFVSVETVIKFL